MNEPVINSQSQAQSHLEKARTYKKLGLDVGTSKEIGSLYCTGASL